MCSIVKELITIYESGKQPEKQCNIKVKRNKQNTVERDLVNCVLTTKKVTTVDQNEYSAVSEPNIVDKNVVEKDLANCVLTTKKVTTVDRNEHSHLNLNKPSVVKEKVNNESACTPINSVKNRVDRTNCVRTQPKNGLTTTLPNVQHENNKPTTLGEIISIVRENIGIEIKEDISSEPCDEIVSDKNNDEEKVTNLNVAGPTTPRGVSPPILGNHDEIAEIEPKTDDDYVNMIKMEEVNMYNNIDADMSEETEYVNSIKSANFRGRKKSNNIEMIRLDKSNGLGYMLKISDNNSEEIDFLIDTGSNYCVIPFSQFSDFEVGRKVKSIKLLAYNDSEIDNEGVYNVELNIPGYGTVSTEVIFCKNETNCILGLKALNKMCASLTYVEGLNQHCLSFKTNKSRNNVTSMIENDITVQPITVDFINLMCRKDNNERLYTSQEIGIEASEYLIPILTNIISVNGDEIHIKALVVNTSDVPLDLKGKIIKFKTNPGRINHQSINKPIRYTTHQIDTSEEKLNLLNSIWPFFTNNNVEKSKVCRCHEANNEDINEFDFNDDMGGFQSEENMFPNSEIHPHANMKEEDRIKLVIGKIEDRNFPADVKEVLMSNCSAFSAYQFDCGLINEAMDFNFSPDFHKNRRVYPLDGKKLESLTKQVNTLLFNGFISKSDQDFGSPTFMVYNRQKDDYRLVVDCRVS